MEDFIRVIVLLTYLAPVFTISNPQPSNSSVFLSCSDETPTFQCIKDSKCIVLSSKCDGQIDCEDGSDETRCHDCAAGWFQCADGHCIHGDWRCDGQHDCMGGDDSDERDCPEDSQQPPVICGPSEFRCSDGLCILKSWICDGEADCYAVNDEGVTDDETPELCGNKTKSEVKCPEYECASGQCILHGWVCDGESDCVDGSDEGEERCGVERSGTDACELKHGMFPCEDGSRCLMSDHVCDGVSQCGDGSDEGAWCHSTSCDSLHCSKGCIRSKEGAQCYCNQGYHLDSDDATCVDLDECSLFGSCSQKCSNSEGSFSCSCHEGYVEQNGTCITQEGEPVLIFSAINEIRALSVRSQMYTQVDINLPHAVGVGFDHLDTRVYWTDAAGGREAVVSKKLSAKTKENLVVSGLDMPEQVAVDEYNKNLYLTESHLKLVVVCSLAGKGCSILASGLDKPRGVDIHHRSRTLFFSDWGSKPAIVKMNLDGSERTNLVETGLVWPNGLAVDQVMDRLYWADSKLDKIETVKIDGSDRREILTTHTIHPFSLAVFEDFIYWSDWETREVISCNKYTGKEYKVLIKEAGIRPMGITVAHPVLLEEELPAPCINNDCSHVCLPLALPSSEYRCSCPSDMIIDQSGKNCVQDPQAVKVFIAADSSFYVTHPRVIGNMNLSLTTSISPSTPQRLASISDADQIFLTARGQSHSHVLAVNTTSGHTRRIVSSDNIVDVAYDPLSENLFWVDIHKSAVMVHSLVTGKTVELLVSVDIPQSLLFVPEKNRLLIAHTNSIVMVYLPNKSIHNVIHENLGFISSMVYSSHDNSVYIGDSGDKKIFKLDLTTETISVFMEHLNQGVVSLAVEDNVLYWVEEWSSNLLWVNTNSSSRDVSWQDLGSVAAREAPIRVVTFTPGQTRAGAACHSANCSHICYNLDNDAGHVCRCPYGMSLAEDNATCVSTCAEDSSVFHCGEGKCIPLTWVCDGTADCETGEDEAACKPESLIIDEATKTDNERSGRLVEPDQVSTSTTHASSTFSSSSSTTSISTTAVASSSSTTVSPTSSTVSTSVSVSAAATTEPTPTSVSTTVSSTTVVVNDDILDNQNDDETDEITASNSAPKDPSVTRTRTSSSIKKNGGIIALAVLLAVLAAMIISILYYKCKRNAKSDFSLSFTNQTFNRSTPRPGSSLVPRIQEPEQELNTVTIVRRGNTTGYDNPGFDSPWARARRGAKLSTLEWPDSPAICSRDAIVCEGSSTPSRKMIKPTDTDSAYQEPSIAASSYSDIRHFSVDDDEQDDSPFFPKDKQRLLKHQ